MSDELKIAVGILLAAATAVVAYFFYFRPMRKDEPEQASPTPQPDAVTFSGPVPAYKPYTEWAASNGWTVLPLPPKPADVPLSAMREAHAAVNGLIEYAPDAAGDYDKPLWANPDDCEGFALAYRDSLMATHPHPSAYRIAHCVTEEGNWHAVLTVWTPGGVWVLDQRKGAPWPLERCNYSQWVIEGPESWWRLELAT